MMAAINVSWESIRDNFENFFDVGNILPYGDTTISTYGPGWIKFEGTDQFNGEKRTVFIASNGSVAGNIYGWADVQSKSRLIDPHRVREAYDFLIALDSVTTLKDWGADCTMVSRNSRGGIDVSYFGEETIGWSSKVTGVSFSLYSYGINETHLTTLNCTTAYNNDPICSAESWDEGGAPPYTTSGDISIVRRSQMLSDALILGDAAACGRVTESFKNLFWGTLNF